MMSHYENLKPGDKVVVYSRNLKEVAEVEKITPSGFIKVAGVLYRKDGSQRGFSDPWYRTSIRPASDAEIEQLQKERFVSEVRSKLWHIESLSYEQAIAVYEILLKKGGDKQ